MYFELYPTDDDDFRAYVEDTFRRHETMGSHPNFAMLAHNPRLADLMMTLTKYLLSVPWVQRSDVHTLLIMICDKRLKSEDSYMAHYAGFGFGRGVSEEKMAALDFPESAIYTDEERMIIEFAHAALDGDVPDDLFERARALYGDREMLEVAVSLAYWTFFPYFINALQTDALKAMRGEHAPPERHEAIAALFGVAAS
jgi:hypothetical protein